MPAQIFDRKLLGRYRVHVCRTCQAPFFLDRSFITTSANLDLYVNEKDCINVACLDCGYVECNECYTVVGYLLSRKQIRFYSKQVRHVKFTDSHYIGKYFVFGDLVNPCILNQEHEANGKCRYCPTEIILNPVYEENSEC